MTVLSQTNKMAAQAMNGIATNFAFTFRALVAFPEAIKATILDTTTDIETNLIKDDPGADGYTVSIDADGIGGSIDVIDSRSADYTITIYREYDLEQLANYADYNSFPAETVENSYDLRCMVEQQLNEILTRTLAYPLTAVGLSTVLPLPDAGKALLWNATADALENSTDDFNDIVTDATAQAAAAAASALASSNSAAASAASAVLSADQVALAAAQVALAATEVTYAAEWVNKAYGSLISAAAGGDLVDDYSSLSWSVAADHWATYPEDSLIPVIDGGDGATDYSALHWAAKAAASAAAASASAAELPTIGVGDANKFLQVNVTEDGYNFVVVGAATDELVKASATDPAAGYLDGKVDAVTITVVGDELVRANLTGGVTTIGNAATVVTNANLTGGVTSVGNAATVITNANLTGIVTSVGNATAIADKAIAVAKLADGTDGELITWDSSGVIAKVPVGTATHILTSNGPGAAPTFQAPPSSGGPVIVGAGTGISPNNYASAPFFGYGGRPTNPATYQIPWAIAGTFSKLYMGWAFNVGGAGGNVNATLYINNIGTALTCGGNSVGAYSDLVNTAHINAGQTAYMYWYNSTTQTSGVMTSCYLTFTPD